MDAICGAAETKPDCAYIGQRYPGAEKYLGGARGPDGSIYAVPGHALRVMEINTRGETRLVGPELPGKFKWLRGILGRDGACYAIPCHAEQVLRIRPPLPNEKEPRIDLVGPKLPGLWKWHGAVEDPATGLIYAIPQTATKVLRLAPAGCLRNNEEPQVDLIGPDLPGRWKFYGGLYSHTAQAIYGIPACAPGVLRIGLPDEKIEVIGDLPEGGWKWHGGCTTADGQVWGIPSNSLSVLRISPHPDGDVVSTIPGPSGKPLVGGQHRDDDKYKYLGGVVSPVDGCMYCIPSDADRILRVDPSTASCSYVGRDLSDIAKGQSRGQNKWQNGFAGADGCIYAIPLKCERVLRIDPTKEDCASLIGGPFEGLNLWEGGVEGSDGALYCMPLKCDRVMRIAPAGCEPLPSNRCTVS